MPLPKVAKIADALRNRIRLLENVLWLDRRKLVNEPISGTTRKQSERRVEVIPRKVDQWRKEGGFTALRVGKVWRYSEWEIQRFLGMGDDLGFRAEDQAAEYAKTTREEGERQTLKRAA